MKPVEVKRGKIFKFLGMTLDFLTPGECHVLQDDKIEDMVNFWPEEIKNQEKNSLHVPQASLKRARVDC